MLKLFDVTIPPLPKNTRVITFDLGTGRPKETFLFRRQQAYVGSIEHSKERVIPCFVQGAELAIVPVQHLDTEEEELLADSMQDFAAEKY